ncbi:UMP-CMP kinase 2, mitochondrial-like [Macrosteles quadrilineatus]|uniref:UMP-CMP kinase 2, mitochondrial-like n=1 Tax=Macrosteles quadrilineatus TaxID=74068 RepID=UPI0023E140F5|nr:UMP-CMP kinase 2, mitochondrial-like [Macrosteles quadrilineatus]
MYLLLLISVVLLLNFIPRTFSQGLGETRSIQIPIFYSLDDVLSCFKTEEYVNSSLSQKVLYSFEYGCKNNIPLTRTRENPFIAIEGNHKTSRKIIARRVAKRIGAGILHNPPRCLFHLKDMFQYGTRIRKAFFYLSMYGSAYTANRIINRWPVVINGYWMDQAAYAISKANSNATLPPSGDPVYKFPEDLLKPDLVFYTYFPDNLHYPQATTRNPNSWKPKMLEIYKRIQDPKVIIINTEIGFDSVVNLIESEIYNNLKDKYMFETEPV